MWQAETFIKYGAYQGFKISFDNQSDKQAYWLMIKKNDVVKLWIGVSVSVTLNPRVSGIDSAGVYDWLWNQGLAFLDVDQHDYDKEVTLLIEGGTVVDGEFDTPWEMLMVEDAGW